MKLFNQVEKIGINPNGCPYLRAFETIENNTQLIFDPATDIIDLEKYIDEIEPDTLGGVPCDSITFKIAGGEEKYYIIDTFEQFKAINTNDTTRGSNSRYIMRQNVDCSASWTTNQVSSDGLSAWVSGVEYKDLDRVLVGTDIYIKTRYITGYDNTVSPELDTEEKYWHIYNYEGFWINAFYGKFNGNGFELQNCYVNKASDCTGVFSYLNRGKLSNIGVTGSVIGYGWDVGGLVGYSNFSIIINSYSASSIVGYVNNIGGLVGDNYSSSITNSYSTSSIVGYNYVGGLVGRNSALSIITNSYSTGSVIGYGSIVGGLVGQNRSSPITNSYSTGSVIGYGSIVGGLVGINASSSVINSYSIGSVIGYGDRVGGLVGSNDSSSVINSYSIGPVIGYGSYVGGLVGYIYNSSIINSYYDLTNSGQSDNDGRGEPRTAAQMYKVF